MIDYFSTETQGCVMLIIIKRGLKNIRASFEKIKIIILPLVGGKPEKWKYWGFFTISANIFHFLFKGKIRTFFKCIYYKAYSMAGILPH